MEPFGLFQLLKSLVPATPPPAAQKEEEEGKTEPSPPPTPPPANACVTFFEAHAARSKRRK